jgi:polyferredoxin
MPIPAHPPGSSCAPAPPGGSGAISLPVLSVAAASPKIRKSKVGPIRAGVLIAVHLAIALHIGFWLASGKQATLSPVEPSEAKDALATGVINAGFIFFVLAILSTLVLGRWFCGWACHLVALQDLCGWAMKKLGVRPKPFRSRLLVFAPLVLAFYMFLGDAFMREIVAPAARSLGWWSAIEPHLLVEAGTRFPAPVFTSTSSTLSFFKPQLTKTEFWETFPREWYIIVPFLGICGFAMVYFLGAKGFCTYGCPYGGFFAPADKLAPARIRVTDACNHCGHCTASCTSNVRVHEEVRDYGMVVDPGCMKCLDCVSVCPNDALYFGLGRPAAFAKARTPEARARKRFKRRVYDLSWPEELALAAVFIALFLAFRQMFDLVPLLMAVGMAGVGSFLAWTLWRLVREPHVRIQSLQLKYRGRFRAAGVVFGLLAISTLALATWSGVVRYSHRRAGVMDHRASAGLQYETVFAPTYTPALRAKDEANTALVNFRRGNRPADGGIGWIRRPDRQIEVQRRMVWLSAVAGDRGAAAGHIRRALEISSEHPEAYRNPGVSVLDLVNTLAQLRQLEGKGFAEFEKELQELAKVAPRAPEVHLILAQVCLQSGRQAEAQKAASSAAGVFSQVARQYPRQAHLWMKTGHALVLAGRGPEALEAFKTAASLEPENHEALDAVSRLLELLGRGAEASEWRNRADRAREPTGVGQEPSK